MSVRIRLCGLGRLSRPVSFALLVLALPAQGGSSERSRPTESAGAGGQGGQAEPDPAGEPADPNRQGLERFDQLYRAAEEARATHEAAGSVGDRTAVRQAYAAALTTFSAVDPATAGYTGRLPAAGWSAVQAGDYGQAERLFAAAIAAGEGLDFVVPARIRARFDADRAQHALELARASVDQWPDAVRQVLIQEGYLFRSGLLAADRLLRSGVEDVGLWAFAYAAEQLPSAAVTQANYGLALRCVGRLDEAEARYDRALELKPDDHTAWNDLGLLRQGRGDLDGAAQAFLRSFELDPDPPTGPATTNLARLEGRLGRRLLPDATASLGRRLTLRPGGALAKRVLLDRIFGRRRVPTARKTRATSTGGGR